MRRSLKLLVGVLVALAITPTAALAEGFVTVGDGEAATTCASLAEAVGRAEEGDTIALGEGTYAVEAPLVISKSLTIQGAGADKTVLQFDEVEAPVDLITVDGGDVSFALAGVCVQGAGSDVLVDSSALTVGSAADPNGGSIVIEGCVFACPTVNVIVLNGGDASLSDNELLCAGCADSLSYGVTVDHGATATFAGNRISGYDALDGGGFVSAVAAQRGGRVVSFAGNSVEGCDVALCLYTFRMEGDTASLPDDVSANSFVDCYNTLSYEIDGEGDLAAILETALPGTTVSLLGEYTLTSAAAVKDGVWLFLADASPSLGVGNVTLAQGGSLTVEEGGTLTVSENTTLFGDVTNYGSVYRFGTITGEVAGDGYVTGLPLVDVQEGTWYYDSVEFVYAYGLMTGYSDGSDRFGTSRASAAPRPPRSSGGP